MPFFAAALSSSSVHMVGVRPTEHRADVFDGGFALGLLRDELSELRFSASVKVLRLSLRMNSRNLSKLAPPL